LIFIEEINLKYKINILEKVVDHKTNNGGKKIKSVSILIYVSIFKVGTKFIPKFCFPLDKNERD
jgi:hypothetical protein